MNENLNLCEILKDCPEGTKLYCTLCGEVRFDSIDNSEFPINFVFGNNKEISFTKEGWYWTDANDAECLLFPSKDQRDWSKFKVNKPKFDLKTLKPFDKILVRLDNRNHSIWLADFAAEPVDDGYIPCTISGRNGTIIPYNEETKHLAGTNEEPPEFYRYWEE